MSEEEAKQMRIGERFEKWKIRNFCRDNAKLSLCALQNQFDDFRS